MKKQGNRIRAGVDTPTPNKKNGSKSAPGFPRRSSWRLSVRVCVITFAAIIITETLIMSVLHLFTVPSPFIEAIADSFILSIALLPIIYLLVFRTILRALNEHERANIEITEREKNFYNLAEESPSMIFIYDMEKIVYANKKCIDTLGYTREELYSPSFDFFDLIAPDDREMLALSLKDHKEGRGTRQLNYNVVTKDGRTITVLQSSNIITHNGKRSILGIVTEITELIRVQRELKNSEENYRRMAENSLVGIFKTNLKGETLYANKAAIEILEFDSPSELVPGNIIKHYKHPEIRELFLKQLEESGVVDDFEIEVISKTGNVKNVLVHAALEGEIITGMVMDITERKRAEETLHASEEKYRGLFDESVAAVYLFDTQKNFIDSNQAGLDLLGYSRSELLKLNMSDVDVAPQTVVPAHRELLAGGRIVNYEHQLKRKDGTIITVLNNSRPLTDSKGDIVGLQSTLLDITERKRTEEALHKANELIRQERNMFISGAVVVFKWKNEAGWPVEYVSPNVKEVFGYTAEEFTSRKVSYANIVPPEDVQRVANEVNKSGNEGKERFVHTPYRIKRKDGKIIWIADHTTIIRDESGEITHYLGYIFDVTERIEAEKALRENEIKLNAIFENAPLVMLLIDRDSRIVKLNSLAASIAKRPMEEVIGLCSGEALGCIHSLDDPRGCGFGPACDSCTIRGIVSKTFQHGETVSREEATLSYNGPDGPADMHLLVSSKPLTVLGKDLSLICMEDITERKKAEEALLDSEEKYKRIVENSHDAIMLTGPDGVISYISPACKRVLGFEPEELVGKQPSIIHPDDLEKAQEVFEKALRGEEGHSLEYRITTKNDEVKWISHSWSPMLSDGGKVQLIVSVLSDITERKRAEQTAHDLAQIVESSLNEVYIFDAETFKFLEVNCGALENIGYSAEELSELTPLDIKPEFTREYFLELVRPLKSGEKKKIVFETVHKRKDGSLYKVEVYLQMSLFNGKPAFVAFILDITKRKEMEQSLRLTQFSVDNSTDPIYWMGPDAKFIYVNRAAVETLGYSKEELLGMDVFDISPEFPREAWAKHWAELKEKKSFVFQAAHQRKDKSKFPVEITVNFIEFDGREINYAIAKDITERKQAEEANNRLSRAIEQANETVVITDAEGTIQYVNPSFEKVTGYTAEEAIGQNPRVLKSGKHDDDFYKNMWETISSGKEWRGEITNKKKNGDYFTENVVISPVYDPQGEIANYVAVKNDITETKRLRELESRAQRLETAGKIAGQVAHDFNNLLGPLIAYPEIIREDISEDHPAVPMLRDMEKAAAQIAEINQQLLTLGRRGHYTLETINLNDVIVQAVNQIEPLPQTLSIDTDISGDLLNIKGGFSQLLRVFSNILMNSIDAMENKGRIFISTENYYKDDISIKYGNIPKGEYAKVTITDTGCGIPDDVLLKIFDPFFTTKTANKKRGSGLGLSVVNAVIKDHNGFIDIKTAVGQGTSFYLYFPITREAVDAPLSENIIGGNEKILVVDDDEIQRGVTLNLLKKLGYEAVAVESGEKAVAFLKENTQDLLILDMMMPGGIDGAETYKRALEINPCQKAVIISGFAETDRVEFAISLGAGAFIRKPLTLGSLSTAIRNELDKVLEKSETL